MKMSADKIPEKSKSQSTVHRFDEKRVCGNVELIEYRDHATAQDITVTDYEEYYGGHTIIMRCIGLVFHEDEDKILVLHEITTNMAPRDAAMKDKVELDFHVVIKGAIINRTILRSDIEVVVSL